MKTQRILELDGLRAFAVLAVIVHHMTNMAGSIPGRTGWAGPFAADLGITGVHVFFVISGFIITLLLLRENGLTGRVSLSSFYMRRALRIIPPFAAYLLTIYGIYRLGYLSVDPANFLYASLFLGNLGLFGHSLTASAWFFAHSWSLSVEEQYYLLLPPIMVALRFRRQPVNALLTSLFCLSFLSPKIAGELFNHLHPSLIKLSAFHEFRYIIAGVLLALHREKITHLLSNTPALVPVALLGFVLIFPHVEQIRVISFPLRIAKTIACGLFVLWFVENPAKCAFLRWQIVQWLGACSYSLYLWQQLFTGKPTWYNGWSISSSPLSIIAILACASLSHYFVEKPSIRLSRYLSGKRPVMSSQAKSLERRFS